MSLTRILATLAVVGAAATLPAAAQDVNARPNFGELTLSGGFTPDPRTVSLRAGGDRNARSIDGSCAGFITAAPDVRLNFTAGSLPLYISVNASTDTTLVINAPNGRYYCADDVDGVNPAIAFNPAQSGRYEIWVGTYASGATQPATLRISELAN